MSFPWTQVRHRGFTLLEVLVTVALVVLLCGLAAGFAREGITKARQASCASNLRQIGTALITYAADQDGRLPKTSHSGGKKNSWIYSLADYLDNLDRVRICPADPHAQRRLAGMGTSYTLNSLVFNPAYDGDGNAVTLFNRLPLIPKPSQTLFATVVSDQKFGIGADHTHSEEWRNWVSMLVDIAPDRFRQGNAAPDRSKGRSNYLYADGHVENRSAAEIKRLCERGVNIAVPPE